MLRLSGFLFTFFLLGRNRVCVNREDHVQPRAFAHFHDRGSHLIHRVSLYLLSAVRAIGSPDAREQQPQVVVDLSRSRDRRTRITRGILLFDRYRRRNAIDQINIRLFDPLQELPGVRRKGFDVAALPLGIDGVEGK